MRMSLGAARAYQNALAANKTTYLDEADQRAKLVPPRNRAINVLKREIYRLACDIDKAGAYELLVYHVRRRDEKWSHFHRPRRPTVVDWTIRLVRSRLLGTPPAAGHKIPIFLFDTVTQARLALELNFAFRHSIDAELASAFIDELGGYAMIVRRSASGQYDLQNEDWVTHFQRRESEMGAQALQFYHEFDDLAEATVLVKPVRKSALKARANSASSDDGEWS